MGLLEVVAVAFWSMLPAYIPNNAAVLAGGGAPIDAGRTLGGRRVLGDGKTWRGTAVGIGAGVLVALGLNVVASPVARATGVALPRFPLLAALALAVGAMLGDVVASFLKRRLGRRRGSSFPVLDQLDFVVGALVLAAVAVPAWYADTFTLLVVVAVLVMTPLLHIATNVGAYLLGFKNVPY